MGGWVIFNIYTRYIKDSLKLFNDLKQKNIIFIIAASSFVAGIIISTYFNLNLITNEVNNDYLFDSDKLWKIIKNNVTVVIVLMSGIILFKIPTIISVFINCFMLGFYIVQLIRNLGFTLIITIIPHGILEFFMFFLAACIGFADYKLIDLKKTLNLSVIIIVGIIVAAFIEVIISANLAKLII